MEAEPRRRLLKRTKEPQAEEKLSFKDLIRKNKEEFLISSIPSTQDSLLSEPILPSDTLEIPLPAEDPKPAPESALFTDEEDDEDLLPANKKKKSARKAKAPSMPKLNRLLNLSTSIYTSEEAEIKETEFLRNAPLQLPEKPKPALTLDCLVSKLKKSESVESPLVKSLLSSTDTLQLEATGSIGRLQLRRETSNPRALLLDSLKRNATDRKTSHYSTDQLLEKSVTELEIRKANPEDDADSDYLPANNEEEEEAKQLQWAIDLEEGVQKQESESDTEEEADEEAEELKEAQPTEGKAAEEEVKEISEELSLLHSSAEEEAEAEDSVNEENNDTESSEESTPVKEVREGEAGSEPQTSATSIAEEPKKVKPLRNRFVEEEAEVGSDNEMHDDVMKPASDKDSSADDGELPELIDNADVDEGDTLLKHTEELAVKDQRELHQVINGDFRKRKNATNYLDSEDGPSKRQKTEYVEFDPFSGSTLHESHHIPEDEDMDAEDASRLLTLQENSRLKTFRRDLDKTMQILDEESQHYLSLTHQPSFSSSTQSLLLDVDKSNSIDRVFQDSSNSASNRGFVFKKKPPTKQEISAKPKTTGPGLRSIFK